MNDPYAQIHDYQSKDNQLDAEGDTMIGFYWQIMQGDNDPLSELTGPYTTGPEAEAACQQACEQGDY